MVFWVVYLLTIGAGGATTQATRLGESSAQELSPSEELASTLDPTLLRTRTMVLDNSSEDPSLTNDVISYPYDAAYETELEPGLERSPLRRMFGSGLGGLLTPFSPAGETTNQIVGQGTLTEGVGARLPFLNATRPGGMYQHLGPLGLDLYAITFTGLYADLNTANAKVKQDGGFLAAINLQGALTLELGESAYLGVGFSLYYLPTVNRVGFYFGNGGTGTAASFKYQTEIGRWQLSVGDEFRVYHPLGDLLNDYEVDEIAVEGRYRFGRADSTLGNRSYLDESVYYVNVIAASATTQLDENWRLRIRAEHADFWNGTNVGKFNDQIFASVGLSYDARDCWYSPWLNYNYYELQNQRFQAHRVMAGVRLPMTPTFDTYLRAGWLFYDYDGISNLQHYLWEAGAVHHINANLEHSFFAGHSYAITDFGDAFMGNYWRYTATLHPEYSRWKFSGSVQQNQNDLDGTKGVAYALRASYVLGDRDSLDFLGVRTHYTRRSLRYERWLTSISFRHTFSPSITGLLTFQYDQYRSPGSISDYDERLVLLSIIKSF